VVDLERFIGWIADGYLPSCAVPGQSGAYARAPGVAEPHVYGTAEAVNIGHTLGELPASAGALADAIGQHQDPATGCFVEVPSTHHELHASAYCAASLRLLDATPAAALRYLDPHRDPATVAGFLAGIDWRDDVYIGSHRGAGLASALVLDDVADEWLDRYFTELDARLDPRTGLHGVDKPAGGDADQIGGTFHYAFLYEHCGRELAHPEARIDAVLALRQPDGWWHPTNHLWLTLDALYLLTRASERTDHRRASVESTVAETVELLAAGYATEPGRRHFEDWYLGAHDLTALVSAFAEAQRYAGGDGSVAHAGRPLRLVLDERPFI
jgi:hypothetical protein